MYMHQCMACNGQTNTEISHEMTQIPQNFNLDTCMAQN
uniref:Uncharacterized protein n=1 Tax=Manihot esculenta TaxID=3983 RepID=A0A2C9VMI7_MANES